MPGHRHFPDDEFRDRLRRVREKIAERGLDGCLVSAPENIYYLTGLNYQGYFAYNLLIVPLEGQHVLVTRAMERATVRDLVPDVCHVVFQDGIEPLPDPEDRKQDVLLSHQTEHGTTVGLNPWSMSLGFPTRQPGQVAFDPTNPAQVTAGAIEEAGLAVGRIGIEKNSSFLPLGIAEAIMAALPRVRWEDSSSLVGDCRMTQSTRELDCTRRAAEISDSMMLAGIAAAGPGVYKRDVVAAIYHAMFSRGGTFPGFVPLVRSTRTLAHEHSTWDDSRLSRTDLLFTEMAGCYWRYHAPIGRLIHIGKATARAKKIHAACRDGLEAATQAMAPGVTAGEVYAAWKRSIDAAGLHHYNRHHCGYSVGIGFPPSWSGGGVPVGLRSDSRMELRPGMVFHVLSWLLRTGRGDSFMSDTVVVTERGSEVLTRAPRDLLVR